MNPDMKKKTKLWENNCNILATWKKALSATCINLGTKTIADY